MCGVTGIWTRATPTEGLEKAVCAMRDRIRSRGPDDAGVWVDVDQGIALGHRRLSIIDLSPSGHQPMVSCDGRIVLAYNGEIYNYREVAEELTRLGVRFRGSSDSEVLVEAIARLGLEATLERLAGMFAFAAWDRADRRLFLARDRLGIKPLYYGWWRDTLLFGSELKAFDGFPGFAPELDRDALTLLLRHCYIPAPHTVWREIRKLPPGHLLECTTAERMAEPRPYWTAQAAALRSQADPLCVTPAEAVEELERVLSHVVSQHMISDVPLGAFLSGGIDSSTVVALMQAQSRRPVRTFTIGFREDAFDESAHARRVATHLGTDHTELYLSSKDAEGVVPELPDLWDEPFADSSQIPTYLVSRLARSAVTVSLSGDGGDELFGGYTRYSHVQDTWRRFGRGPAWARRLLAAGLRSVPRPLIDGAFGAFWRMHRPDRSDPVSEVARRRADQMSFPTFDAFYLHAISHWQRPETVVRGACEPRTWIGDENLARDFRDPVEYMMMADTLTYLPDDILTKVDRASMAVSLEARVPLLDHRVFELAWRLPLELRVRNGITKWPLREILARHIPRPLFERPKQGFGVPIGEWLRGSLRPWGEDLLSEDRLRRDGVFDPAPIREAWTKHLAGWPLENALWAVLMFQAWWERRSARRTLDFG